VVQTFDICPSVLLASHGHTGLFLSFSWPLSRYDSLTTRLQYLSLPFLSPSYSSPSSLASIPVIQPFNHVIVVLPSTPLYFGRLDRDCLIGFYIFDQIIALEVCELRILELGAETLQGATISVTNLSASRVDFCSILVDVGLGGEVLKNDDVRAWNDAAHWLVRRAYG